VRLFPGRKAVLAVLAVSLTLLAVSCWSAPTPPAPSSAPAAPAAPTPAAHSLPPVSQATVSIVKGEDPDSMVAEAISLLGGLGGLIKDGQTVVIKPNLVTPDKAEEPGLMTDVRIVEAIIKEIRKVAKCRIVVAEGSASEPTNDLYTKDAFERNGYGDLVKKYGVELKDLNEDHRITVRLAGLGYDEYEMPETIMKCDCLIDVPLLKTHCMTGVTLGMKCLFGLMPLPKARFHAKLDGVLCDIIRMRRPDLVVVDGLVGTEGQGPLRGKPIRMDLVLAGRDIVAVDAVSTAVMGYEPRTIRHLALAAENGLGEIDLAKIAVKGRPIAEVRHLFEYAKWNARIALPKTEALTSKILALADRARDIRDEDEAVVGKRASFKAESLAPDKAKYPRRTSYGFRVNIMNDSGLIEFLAPYETVIPENCQAAIDEMYRWIEANLGTKEKGEAGPEPPSTH